LAEALRNPASTRVILPALPAVVSSVHSAAGESPRQLVGQPAAPGLATGKVRKVRDAQDLGRFRAGEVLVCDAIQPTITHLVPLASAIVERRGGMLIHGAIIARELGIPCVNGIPHAVELLEEGEIITVDGYLGIVTVGAPEFDLEGA
jgi:phosphoenolpyruvate synthase/pyruvate phosphate dikinase